MLHFIVDIHTHNRPVDARTAIVNLAPWETIPDQGWYSLGIHPWSIGPDGDIVRRSWSASPEGCIAPQIAQSATPMETAVIAPAITNAMTERVHGLGEENMYGLDETKYDTIRAMDNMMYTKAQNPRVLAIGEAGIDHLCTAPLERQIEVFGLQARLAERLGKPLIIHSVRATSEILQVRRQIRPTVPWVIHGFRGGVGLARQLLDYGFYLSFGERYQSSALRETPKNRLFIETDQSHTPIHELYRRAANVQAIPPQALLDMVNDNIRRIFGLSD